MKVGRQFLLDVRVHPQLIITAFQAFDPAQAQGRTYVRTLRRRVLMHDEGRQLATEQNSGPTGKRRGQKSIIKLYLI